MAQMICPKCQKQIDDTSVYCTFCGEKITKEPIAVKKKEKQKGTPNPATIAKAIIQICMVIALIAAIVLLVVVNNGLKEKVDELSSIHNELSQKYEEVNGQLESTTKKLNKANETISNQKSSNTDLRAENTKLQREIKDSKETLDDLYSGLRKSKTSNGTISTSSKVYCIKKGESSKIKITWNKAATMYMSYSGYSVSAEWSGDDIKITGKSSGVSIIEFSSDQAGKNNVFQITVICYE